MPRRPLLALGLLLAVVLMAGCGSENPELLTESRASALTSTVDEITAACEDNDAAKAKAAVQAANQQVSELPRRVDSELKSNLRDWLDHIDDRIDEDCAEEEPEPTETATPEPTETATPEPTETPVPTPTVEPPGDGGVIAPEDGQ
jgi:outer membrane biosynthesis protein TonB